MQWEAGSDQHGKHVKNAKKKKMIYRHFTKHFPEICEQPVELPVNSYLLICNLQ